MEITKTYYQCDVTGAEHEYADVLEFDLRETNEYAETTSKTVHVSVPLLDLCLDHIPFEVDSVVFDGNRHTCVGLPSDNGVRWHDLSEVAQVYTEFVEFVEVVVVGECGITALQNS